MTELNRIEYRADMEAGIHPLTRDQAIIYATDSIYMYTTMTWQPAAFNGLGIFITPSGYWSQRVH